MPDSVRSTTLRPSRQPNPQPRLHQVAAFPLDTVFPNANDDTDNKRQQSTSRVGQHDAQGHECQTSAQNAFLKPRACSMNAKPNGKLIAMLIARSLGFSRILF